MAALGLTAAAAAFRPAAALVGRLRYAHKFVVVGLILLVPLGLVSAAYVRLQRDQIAFSAKERVGVEIMMPLVTLTADFVESRHLAVAGTAGDARRPDLDADLARMDALDRRYGAQLHTSADWEGARWLVLAAERGNGPIAGRFQAYNAATDSLLELIVEVGDESNLTLDPDLDTYYLMDTLQFRLPVLLDTAGRSVDAATVARENGSGAAQTDAYIEVGLYNGVLASTRKAIGQAVRTVVAHTADPEVRSRAVDRFTELDTAAGTLGDTLYTGVESHSLSAITPHSADTARSAAADVAAGTAAWLDRLLQARIDRFSARSHRVELGAGLAALLGIYLFAGFYLSVVSPVRRIVDALRAVAGGDLSRRVAVDTHDELSFVAEVLNDTVTQTKIATDRLAEQATRDALTGLPNRALVLDRLQQALARAERTGRPMAALFIDLDRFKIINDSLGHETGDGVLRAVAERLTATVRQSDTVGRLAGDEFVVISEDLAGVTDVVEVAERIVEVVSEPITATLAGVARELSVGASIGVAVAHGDAGLDAADLLRNADMAMYAAKQRGRGRVEIFGDALRVAVERRLEVQDDLRHGIEAGQVRVHYQPITDTVAGTIVGFEALARWEHPTRGLLGAADFVEVAEETGLIVPLGAAVLAEACRQAAEWRASRAGCERLHIAVNVSGPQLGHNTFVPAVADILARTGLDPDALWLEITETSIMADPEAVSATLATIRGLGVHVAIDDFGTGYSSLAYLRRFPVDILKIDRSFVAGLDRDREDEAIVDLIISLAATLDLLVVAEGVETAAQLDQLRRLGCGTVQGYYLGRPAPPETAWDSVHRPAAAQVA
jgi:diguanylate cyclase (GGDEF)-like protein